MDEPNPVHLEAYFTADPPASGTPRTFGIVTAFNPGSAPAPEDANRKADHELEAWLSAERLAHFRVTGRSRDGAHQEPGFGVPASSPEDIRRISRRFRQEAFFWVEDGAVFVINTDGIRRHPVGRWEDRLLNAPSADRPKRA